MDFNGHRYVTKIDYDWWPPAERQEAYLNEYEAKLRHDYLDGFQRRRPAMAERAIELQQEARSVAARIDAILWARDAMFDLCSVSAGPSQIFSAVSNDLLRDFLAHYLPNCAMEDLLQGHHPDIDPYFPQVQVAKAEELAQSVGADRRAFAEMDMRDLFVYLANMRPDSPFMQAFGEYCNEIGLTPPGPFANPDGAEWRTHRPDFAGGHGPYPRGGRIGTGRFAGHSDHTIASMPRSLGWFIANHTFLFPSVLSK